jgi:hypothetical protein
MLGGIPIQIHESQHGNRIWRRLLVSAPERKTERDDERGDYCEIDRPANRLTGAGRAPVSLATDGARRTGPFDDVQLR